MAVRGCAPADLRHVHHFFVREIMRKRRGTWRLVVARPVKHANAVVCIVRVELSPTPFLCFFHFQADGILPLPRDHRQ